MQKLQEKWFKSEIVNNIENKFLKYQVLVYNIY